MPRSLYRLLALTSIIGNELDFNNAIIALTLIAVHPAQDHSRFAPSTLLFPAAHRM